MRVREVESPVLDGTHERVAAWPLTCPSPLKVAVSAHGTRTEHRPRSRVREQYVHGLLHF